MEISAWFDSTDSTTVNEVALIKKYIWWSICQRNALNFDRQSYIIRELNNMSRKVKANAQERRSEEPITSQPTRSSGTSRPATKWASADIRSREHKAAVREMAANVSFILDTIVELVDDGYDLHIKRANEGSTVRSMLFCTIPHHANKGGGLSAEAPDAWLSITALIYKHVHLLEGNWFDVANGDTEDDGWR